MHEKPSLTIHPCSRSPLDYTPNVLSCVEPAEASAHLEILRPWMGVEGIGCMMKLYRSSQRGITSNPKYWAAGATPTQVLFK